MSYAVFRGGNFCLDIDLAPHAASVSTVPHGDAVSRLPPSRHGGDDASAVAIFLDVAGEGGGIVKFDAADTLAMVLERLGGLGMVEPGVAVALPPKLGPNAVLKAAVSNTLVSHTWGSHSSSLPHTHSPNPLPHTHQAQCATPQARGFVYPADMDGLGETEVTDEASWMLCASSIIRGERVEEGSGRLALPVTRLLLRQRRDGDGEGEARQTPPAAKEEERGVEKGGNEGARGVNRQPLVYVTLLCYDDAENDPVKVGCSPGSLPSSPRERRA